MVKKKITAAIVQARYNSIRLPGKVMYKINNLTLIEILYKRLLQSKKLDLVIIATTNENKKFIKFLKEKKMNYFVGSKNNVLKRYCDTAKKFNADTIVRITGDGIIADPKLIDQFLIKFNKENVDYLSNQEPITYPDGLDIEIFNFKTLLNANKHVIKKYDKEHVTPYIIRHTKKKLNLTNSIDYSNIRLTIDEQDDLKTLKGIFKYFYPNIHFGWKKILKLILNDNKKYIFNSHIKRNEGANMSKTEKLWKRAKQIIPGGNMFLSKRPELHLPNKWPAYYSKSKDVYVWDLDKKKYTDMSLMGAGCNILGYANKQIDNAVIKSIQNSNSSTLNCAEEVELCEKILSLHTWADMAKLTRTGGEAAAACVRIARAASGKNKIAFCGYHGWHDWYLSANLKSKNNLTPHLMGGLDPNGVPTNLKDTAFPFRYNNINELEKIIEENDLGAIKMEVSRNFSPNNNFLKKIRSICDKKNIILIFDECSAGFRQTFGGLHKHYGVNPDMAWFGKSLGNGFSISAIIGKKEIMEHSQSTFMSSTFWSERSGPVAGVETLKQMEKLKSWKLITNKGEKIQKMWKQIGKKNNLEITVQGLPALSSFSLNSKDWIKYKTFITQEMLKRKILASNAIFVSVKHSDQIITNYLEILDEIFYKISQFENGKLKVDEYLENPLCQVGFQRLN